MLNYILFLILCMLLTVYSYTNLQNGEMEKYLSNMARYVNNELNIGVIDHAIKERDAHKTFESLSHAKNILNTSTSFHLVSLFNKSYCFDGSLYEVVPGETNFFVHRIDFVNLSSRGEEVKFIRTVHFNNLQFILVCLENGISKVYTGKNISDITFIHSLKSPDFITDAKFFVNNYKLYLVTTSTHLDSSLSTTLVYEWLETYFDRMNEISSISAVSVFTFPIKKSEIIIILQNSTARRGHSYSSIYEFFYGRMEKIQHLPTNNPYHMTKYVFSDYTYFIIFNESHATLYRWNEVETVYLADLPTPTGVEKIRTIYVRNVPILFIITKAKIVSYNPTDNFRLLYNSTFEQPFKKIYEMETIEFDNKQFLYYVGRTESGLMELNSIQFTVYSTETDSKVREKNRLMVCLSNLGARVNDDRQKLHRIIEINRRQKHEFDADSVLARTHTAEKQLNNLMVTNYDKVSGILNEINLIATDFFQPNTAVFDGRVNIQGRLRASILNAKNIYVNKLNSIEWFPEGWLSFNTEQTLTGKITTKHLTAEYLRMPKGNQFENALLINVNQRLYGTSKFESLESTELYSGRINDITLNNIFFKDTLVSISGRKTFGNLKANILSIAHLNGKNVSDILQHISNSKELRSNFGSTINITSLEVGSINDVHWDTFKRSVFRLGKTDLITGNLVINNYLKVKALNTKSINEIGTQFLLTTTTNQNVTSKINFGKLNSNKLSCAYINGLNLKSDTISLFDENKRITGPVTINSAIVLKNLYANINENNTQKPQFQQIYKTVKVVGVVRIENLHFQPNLVLTVNGKEFNTGNVIKRFWLKHTDQIVPTHKVLRRITAPYLLTDSLNGINMSDYMLNNMEKKPFTIYKFQNVTVTGNITIDDGTEHFPNLLKVKDNCIRLTGSFEISGRKTFNGILTGNTVTIDYLDGIDVDQALTVTHQEVRDGKQFQNLIIKENLTVKHSDIQNLNGVDLNSIYDQYFYAGRPVHVKTLKMEKASVDDLQTVLLNKENLNRFILNLDQINTIKRLNRVKIDGNVVLSNIANLTHLNDINFNVIADKVSGERVIVEKVKFTGDIFIKNFNTPSVNNIDMLDMGKMLMSRYYPQRITAHHHFKRLTTSTLLADNINNVDMTCIIHTKTKEEQTLLLRDKLTLISPIFEKSLAGNLPCDINTASNKMKDPSSSTYWQAVTILRCATIEDRQNILSSILEYAVAIGRNNTITKPVTFAQATAKHVRSRKAINGIDIQEIYKDALMKYNQDELVTGAKMFNILTTAGVTSYGNTDIPMINNIYNIQEIERNLIPKDKISTTIVRGHKTFNKGFRTTKLQANEILNVKPENLVNLQNLKRIPQVSFDAPLHVQHNLNTFNVNHKNFTSFLENRILKKSSTKQTIYGVYYFDDAHFSTGHINTPVINEIKLNDVVFDAGVQNIQGSKEFAGDVIIIGNTWINRYDGINVTSEYENSVLINKETKIEAHTIFENIGQINNSSTNNLNGIPVETLKRMLLSETPKIKAKIVQGTVDRVKHIIRTSSNIINGRKFLYLDKFQEFPLGISNVASTQAVETQGHVMIHLLSQESGYACGLKATCNCFIQNTIQLTPEFSLHLITNKINQRVYSYEDDTLVVHVITNTTSYSSECRSLNGSALEEYTTLTIINKASGHTFVHKNEVMMDGYISQVQFFRFHDNIYIVFCKTYNILMKAQTDKCFVIKVNERQKHIETIQDLPTTAFSSIYIFQTPQQVNLIIIGNKFTDTSIYTFDHSKEKFLLLREISSIYCTSATSIFIEPDSFLMLSQRNNRIAVWKYNHKHRNYYFYQDLILDSPATSISSFNNKDLDGTFIYALTENGTFYVYNFQYIEGWKLLSRGELKKLQMLKPFSLNNQTYLLAPSSKMISLLRPISDGQN